MNPNSYVDSSACYGRNSLCFYPQYNALVSYGAIAAGHAGYIVVLVLLRQFMANREAYHMNYPMMIYNAVQVILSVIMAVNLSPFLGNYIFNINGRFTGRIEFWILVHYVTKYLDMFDTIFMVLRKKDEQISFLHVYHHLTIGLIWGLLLHNGIANGTAFFGAWINSVVHALMYFHYLYTAFGYTNPFKACLTQIQMIQFALCILQAVLVVMFDRQIPSSWAWLQFGYHMSLLHLFMKFYLSKIRKPSGSKKTGAKAEE